MKANRIDLFSSIEKTAWEEFHEKRTSEIKTQFPDASSNEIEHRVWIEFIAMKYSLSLPINRALWIHFIRMNLDQIQDLI